MIKRNDIFKTKVHSYCEVAKSTFARSSRGKEGRSSPVDRRVGEWSVNVKPGTTERLTKL